MDKAEWPHRFDFSAYLARPLPHGRGSVTGGVGFSEPRARAKRRAFAFYGDVTVEQKDKLSEVIWVDPERMSGTPCFKGTRVPVRNLLDYIEGGSTIGEFFEDFPSVTREQVTQFLELGKEHLVECVSS